VLRILTVLLSSCLASCGGGSGTGPAVPLQPGSASSSIAEVQGRDSVSPLVGRTVIISGVVTGDFQQGDADNYRNLGGFYIQDDSPDKDPASSDGIFVFDGNRPATDVSAGDRVTVQGTVSEYFGETQITEPMVMITGAGYVRATDIKLPVERTSRNSDGELIADLERYEGMLVRFPQTLSVTDLRNLEQFGAVSLSQGGRLYQFTNSNTPDSESYSAHKSLKARRSIELDDGKRTSNATPVRYLTAGKSASYSIRNGDTITGVIGNLRYSRGSGANGDESWRLMPTMDPLFDSANPRPDKPVVAGSVRIASLNVLNFYSTVDSGQNICGPQGSDGCRGADSARELKRQLAKIVTALQIMDADIVGLIELENNADASLQMIVDALNARIGSNAYAFLDTGSIHNDAIKTGFIYKPSSIALVGGFALLDRNIDSRFNDARNRPALAQSFEVTASGAVLTVVVNHLKSKGSSCADEGDPNLGDGQGNCNRARTTAAAAIADWLSGDPTGSGDSDYLIIGDLNAYVQEDPLTTLRKKGFTNLLEAHGKPYSFVFDAQAGALDHALASASLVPQVIQTAEWHINADEPPLLDYNLENGRDAAVFDADIPYRTSDHDPVIVGLDLVP
jgi:predicted extracellular nuclease